MCLLFGVVNTSLTTPYHKPTVFINFNFNFRFPLSSFNFSINFVSFLILDFGGYLIMKMSDDSCHDCVASF